MKFSIQPSCAGQTEIGSGPSVPAFMVSWTATVLAASPPSYLGDVLDTTYLQLYGVHEKNLELANGQVSDQVLRNHKATLSSFLAFANRTTQSRIGREFTVEFVKMSRAYAESIAVQNRKTAADKMSILRSWKRTIDRYVRETALKSMAGQSTFHKELRLAIAGSGKSINEIAKAIYTDKKTLTGWYEGVMPIFKAVPAVRRLENYFGMQTGFLEKQLVFPRKEETIPPQAHADRFEGRMRAARKDPYYVSTARFSETLLGEWAALLKYKTDVDPENLKRSARAAWRTLPVEKAGIGVRDEPLAFPSPGMVASSALRTLLFLQSFLGFLTKPTSSDPAKSGLGLKLEDVGTLASLAIPEFISPYMNFVKARSGGLLHNGHCNAAGIIVGLCREFVGFLWQQPEVYESRIAKFANGRPWTQLCEQTIAKCKIWQVQARGKKSRDPKENLKPLTMAADSLAPFKRAMQKLDLAAAAAAPGSVHQAIYKRDAMILGLCLFNPLRHRTLTIAKYDEAGFEGDPASNLYRRKDGQWWLQFDKDDFKNGESKDEDYNSPVTEGLTQRIDEYVSVYRPVLVRKNPDERSLFPSRQGEQMGDIGEVISRIAKNYIPEVRRLRMHALRHIVASDFLKRNPGQYTVLAGLLHDTLDTVLKHYAHGTMENASRAQERNMKPFYEGL